MTYIESFDDLDETYGDQDTEALRPFQFREDTSEKGTLEWLRENFDNCLKRSANRLEWYRESTALYKGAKYVHPKDSGRKPKHVVNFVQDMVENKVAARAKITPAITVIPKHDEQTDINNSKGCKMLLDDNAAKINLEYRLQEQDRRMFKFGTGILYIYWDEDAGPLHPKYQSLLDRYDGDIPANIKKKIKGSINIGDVRVKEISPARFYPELNREKWEDVTYVDTFEFTNLHELRAKYPKKKDDIQLEDVSRVEPLKVNVDSYVLEHLFICRPNKFWPEGAMIKWCDGAILSWKKFPYKHGELPFDVATDIPLDNIWGMSLVHNIKQLQRMFNSVQSAIAYDISSVARKKWMLPKGAASFQSLDNSSSVCEWSGQREPKLVSNTPMTAGMLPFQDKIEERISKQARVYDVVKGDLPPGITANSALQFIDEQGNDRDVVGITAKKTRIRRIGRMRMSLMGQYYHEDDNRTVRILGPENTYLIQSMKKVDFSLASSVELQNTSKLPDSKTGMISTIIDMNAMTQTDPTFKPPQIMQLLDMGNDEIFKTRATVAVTAAKTVLDNMLSGMDVPEPQMGDDFLIYYDVFCCAMQGMTFRTKTSEDIKTRIQGYIKVLEGLMYMRAIRNMKFLMQVLELDMFPIYFEPPAPLMPPMPMEGGGAQDMTKVDKLPQQFNEKGEQ